MELRHLRYFVTVAEELNFTRAARRLRMAQPPLSRQIHQLERELGATLLERRSGRLFLTNAGRVLQRAAVAILAQSDRAVENVRQAHAGKAGSVRVGIAWGLGDIVSRVLSEHAKRWPEIEIQCRNTASGAQNDALRLGELDVGFLRPPIDPGEVISRPLFRERLSVVVSKASPIARFRSLRLKQLADATLLLIPRNVSSGAFDKTLDLFDRAGLHPRLIQTETLPYEEAGSILVASGRGIYFAVGDEPVHATFRDRIKAIPLDEPDAFMDVHLGWRRQETSSVVLEFVETVNAMLTKFDGLIPRRAPKYARPDTLKQVSPGKP